MTVRLHDCSWLGLKPLPCFRHPYNTDLVVCSRFVRKHLHCCPAVHTDWEEAGCTTQRAADSWKVEVAVGAGLAAGIHPAGCRSFAARSHSAGLDNCSAAAGNTSSVHILESADHRSCNWQKKKLIKSFMTGHVFIPGVGCNNWIPLFKAGTKTDNSPWH